MAYDIETIKAALANFVQDQAMKFDVPFWLDFEIQRLVNRKRWWWRKKTFSFPLVVGTATYDLSRDGLNQADDLDQMISMYTVDSSGNLAELVFTSKAEDVQAFIAETSTEKPCKWTIDPGTSKTIRLDVKSNSTDTLRGVYWASYNPAGDQTSRTIPLIPEHYHYVPILLTLKRIFLYLFGQKDERYAATAQDAAEAVAELERYNAPATGEYIELRDMNPGSTIRATD